MADTGKRLAYDLVKDIWENGDKDAAWERTDKRLQCLAQSGFDIFKEELIQDQIEDAIENGYELQVEEAWLMLACRLSSLVCNPNELRSRWFVFLEKMEAKMEQLCDEELPKLTAIENIEKARLYSRKIAGQLQNIHNRAHTVYEEEIIDNYYRHGNHIKMGDALFDRLYDFRSSCEERYNKFTQKRLNYIEKLNKTFQKKEKTNG
ncbi:MAG: hypothetical protein LBQ28_01625 [Prevotellaceae bacterium]|jgi:hypothetical protein|nr:hypothetical protein [Prevotellaceae bacterium]